MGNFMIPVCCVCGQKAKHWNDGEWYKLGGRQDFCPIHASTLLTEYFYGENLQSNCDELFESLKEKQ